MSTHLQPEVKPRIRRGDPMKGIGSSAEWGPSTKWTLVDHGNLQGMSFALFLNPLHEHAV